MINRGDIRKFEYMKKVLFNTKKNFARSYIRTFLTQNSDLKSNIYHFSTKTA